MKIFFEQLRVDDQISVVYSWTIDGGAAGLVEVVEIQRGGQGEVTIVGAIVLVSQLEYVSVFTHEEHVR